MVASMESSKIKAELSGSEPVPMPKERAVSDGDIREGNQAGQILDLPGLACRGRH